MLSWLKPDLLSECGDVSLCGCECIWISLEQLRLRPGCNLRDPVSSVWPFWIIWGMKAQKGCWDGAGGAQKCSVGGFMHVPTLKG